MPQAANTAPTSLHICRLRATRLTAAGAAASGATGAYVSDRVISLDQTVELEEGEDRRLTSGCNTTIVSNREADRFIRFTFTLELGSEEWRLLELLTGQTLFQDTSTIPVPVGINFPTTTQANPPDVAFEVWTDAYETGAQLAVTPYLHFVYPRTRWRIDDTTLENDWKAVSLTGYSLANSGWGTGPWADLPTAVTAVGELGGMYQAATRPTAALTYVTVP